MTAERVPPSNERELLVLDEGRRRSAYQDHLGYWTIGVGRLIDERKGGGISIREQNYLLDNDIADKRAELDLALPWWKGLDAARQAVLLNMAFQMGTDGLLGFANTLYYVKFHSYAKAAQGMRSSLWARQTPERAERLAMQMETGRWI